MNRIIVVILALVLLAGLFFLLNFGDGKDQGGNGKTSSGQGTSGTTTDWQKTPPPGGSEDGKTSGGEGETKGPRKLWTGPKVFRFPEQTNPPTLDPVKITDVTSDGVARKIFNTLVRFDRKMQPVPELAEAMPVWNETEKSYTFKLRRGVKFHNGREVKAQDVKYSWERLLDPAVSKRMQILEPVVGAKEKIEGKGEVKETRGLAAVDDYTFKVTLTGTHPTFLLEIGMINAAVVPKEAVEEKGDCFSTQPMGTGPFKLVEWLPNNRIELLRHEEYFKGKPKIEKVVYEIIPQPQMRLDRFLKGEFESCDIPFGQLRKLRQDSPELISQNSTFRTNYLGITIRSVNEKGESHIAEPLGGNLNLRQAINHAIDRKNICSNILEDRGVPAWSILPKGMLAHDDSLQGWTCDIGKAKEYLAKAGFPNGAGLRTLNLLYRQDPDIRKIVVAIQADLQAIGIKVDLQALDWTAFLERVDKNPPDLFYLGWVADYNDPDNFLYYLFHTRMWGDPGNHTRYSNPEVDKLLDEAHRSLDQDKRKRLYQQAERVIVSEVAWALVDARVNYILLQPYVRNVREQLCELDVGPGLNQVEFGEVDFIP